MTEQRTPPHNLEAEQALLGAMLLSRDAVATVTDMRVAPDDYYKPNHGNIHDAITSIYEHGDPADHTAVADRLRRAGLDDAARLLGDLIAGAGSTSNAAHYARIVTEHSLLRRLIGVAGEIAEIGYELPDDVVAAIDRAEQLVYQVADSAGRGISEPVGARQATTEFLDELEARFERGEEITGVPTGFHDLDDLTLGLHRSNLVICGARPSMGKTAFALRVARTIAGDHQLPVLFCSIEMSRSEIWSRVVTQVAKIDAHYIRSGKLGERDWNRLNNHLRPIADLPLWVYDEPLQTVASIRSAARRLKSRYGLSLVVVDYLQLMAAAAQGRGRPENRQVEVSEMSRGLKVLARELELPVLALSQLSRNLEYRADKRPVLADLRESGSIEQDADVVLFLYRDEVYNAETPDKGTAEVIVAKQRNGPTGMARLGWIGQYTTFSNLARGSVPAAAKEAS